jgi:hypothetical protein
MLKFKEGDIVEITDNKHYHGFSIGEHVTISLVVEFDNEDDGYYNGYSKVSGDWSFREYECKAIEGVLQ